MFFRHLVPRGMKNVMLRTLVWGGKNTRFGAGKPAGNPHLYRGKSVPILRETGGKSKINKLFRKNTHYFQKIHTKRTQIHIKGWGSNRTCLAGNPHLDCGRSVAILREIGGKLAGNWRQIGGGNRRNHVPEPRRKRSF